MFDDDDGNWTTGGCANLQIADLQTSQVADAATNSSCKYVEKN